MIGAEAFAGEYLGAFVESLQPDYACFFILVFFRPVPISFSALPAAPGEGEKR